MNRYYTVHYEALCVVHYFYLLTISPSETRAQQNFQAVPAFNTSVARFAIQYFCHMLGIGTTFPEDTKIPVEARAALCEAAAGEL